MNLKSSETRRNADLQHSNHKSHGKARANFSDSDIETIADTEYYKITYSHSKNRFYLTITGFWRNVNVVSNYLQDWKKAVGMARPNFTLLTDVTEAKTYPQAVMKLHNQAQEMVVKSGLLQVAEVLPESVFLNYQSDVLAQGSQMSLSKFSSVASAEEWLDQVVNDLSEK